jgi:apolipoprotein N-acyltransferase
VIATPAAERDVALTLRSFGKVQAALQEASRRWSGVLLVQLLLFASVTGGFATWVLTRSNLDAGDMVLFAAFVLPVLWPLVLSFAAVVRANALFDEIPARVTSEFLFTPAVRAPPYNR